MVKDDLLACGQHWAQVPEDVQREVYRSWRRRQALPEHQTAIEDHVDAMREAISHMTELEA